MDIIGSLKQNRGLHLMQDTISKSELIAQFDAGKVEIYKAEDLQRYIADVKASGDADLMKAAENELQQLTEHVAGGQLIYIRQKNDIRKAKDKDGKEGRWITTEDGNHAFIGGDGKLNFTADDISKVGEDVAAREGNKEDVEPEIVKKLNSSKFNGKFYGKEGKWTVYLNGKETRISNEEKTEYEKYTKEKNKADKDKDREVDFSKNENINAKKLEDFYEKVGKKSFNGKVYGRVGSYSCYIAGEKVDLDDETGRSLATVSDIFNVDSSEKIKFDDNYGGSDLSNDVSETIDMYARGDLSKFTALSRAKEYSELPNISIKKTVYDHKDSVNDFKGKVYIYQSSYKNKPGYGTIKVVGQKNGKEFKNESKTVKPDDIEDFIKNTQLNKIN